MKRWILITAGIVAALIAVAAIRQVTSPSGDKVACGRFYSVVDNNLGYSQDLSGINKAVSQAASEPLKSALQSAAYDFANSNATVDELGTVDDCTNLGFSDPANGG